MSVGKGKIVGLMLVSAITVALTMMAANQLVLGQIRREAIRQATVQQESSMATFWEMLYCKGRDFRLEKGGLFAGGYRLDGANDLVDEVLCTTGSRATVFLGERRVATNVLLPDGRRALGTRMPAEVYDTLYRQRLPYRGRISILGAPYFTAYDPIRDPGGRVIGALFVGVREDEYLSGYDRIDLKITAINGTLAAVFVLFAFLMLAERKRSQDAIEKQLSFLRVLSDTIPSPLFAKDARGRYNHANQAFLSFVGLSREELIGKSVEELWSPEVAKRYREADRELMERTGTQSYEFLARHADGTLREVIYSKATFWDEQGVPGGIVGVMLDITDRKAAEQEVRNAYQRMADILEFLPDAAFVVDAEKRVIAWNRAMEEMTGVPKEMMLGKGDQAYALPLYGERHDLLIDLLELGEEELALRYQNAKREGRTIFGEMLFERYRGGEERILSGAAAPLLDREGNRIGSIETMRDVTELRRAQRENGRLEAQLHHSMLVESLMVQLSHDLKTPLTPLFALLPLMGRRIDDPQLLRMLEICRQSAAQIQGLADKSLQLVRLSWRGERPALLPLSICAVAQAALDEARPLLERRGVSCRNAMDDELQVLGIREQLALLFKNLLENAARYTTGQGRVEMGAAREGEGVRVWVRDDGIGLAPEHLSLIFSEFFKADAARHDLNTPGLGLAICQRIVANHRGRIWAESPGKGLGTTIFFTLTPAAPAAAGRAGQGGA